MSIFGKPPFPPEKKTAQDFDYIYNPDSTCAGRYDCGAPGVVLAYDEFSPEGATWFCSDCWEEIGGDPFLPSFLTIVEDKRPKFVTDFLVLYRVLFTCLKCGTAIEMQQSGLS